MSWYFASAESFTYCDFFCLGKWSHVVSWEGLQKHLLHTARNLFKLTRCPSLQDSWRLKRSEDGSKVIQQSDRKQKFFASPTKKSELLHCPTSVKWPQARYQLWERSCAVVLDQDLKHAVPYACLLGDVLPRIKMNLTHCGILLLSIVQLSPMKVNSLHETWHIMTWFAASFHTHWSNWEEPKTFHVWSVHNLRFSCAALHCACLNWEGSKKPR